MGPKMDTLSLRYFWALSRPCGSDRQILEGVEACSVMSAVCSATRAFPLLPPSFSLFPLPTAAFTIMAKRKATTEELGARAETNGYKRGAHREKDSTRDNGKHNKKTKRSQNSVLDRYVS
jgi:hypothetical protein